MFKMSFYKISKDGLGELSSRIIAKVRESKIHDLLSSAEFKMLIELSELYQESLGKIRKSEQTEKIHDKDAERDDSFIGLKFHILSKQKAKKPEIAEAAVKAKQLIDNFGSGIDKLTYNEESQKLKLIIAEFKKESNIDLIKILGIEEWIGELESLQTEFDALLSNRIDDKTGKSNIKSATSVKREISDALNVFINHAESYADIKKTDDFKKIVTDINKIIKEVETAGLKKLGKTEKKIEEVKK